MSNHFQGQDGFVWFTGVVEDRKDPTKLGRVRVRCVGYHTDDKIKIPTEDLPWAWVMQNIHTPSMAGWGETPGFMVEGTWVVGFFRDADELQEPIVIGTLPGIPENVGDPTKGFNDPNPSETNENVSNYPPNPLESSKHDINESDVNRLARNETDKSHNMLQVKSTSQSNFTNLANQNPFGEPLSAYEAEYPYNHVMETESGHIREYDDTKHKERIHEWHKSGTYYEIDGGGSRTVKIVGDGYHIIAGSDNVFVGGNCNMTVDGNCNMYIKKDWNIQVDGDMNLLVEGNKREEVLCKGDPEEEGFSYEIVKNGRKQISVDGDYTQVYGKKYEEHYLGDVSRNYAGALSEFVTGEGQRHYTLGLKEYVGTDFEQHIGTTSKIFINGDFEHHITGSSKIYAGASLDIDSGSDITIDGTTVNINQGTKGAARLDDTAIGTDTAGLGAGTVNSTINAASGSVKIGDGAGSMTAPTAPTAPIAAADSVETQFTSSTTIKDATTASSEEVGDKLSAFEVVDVDIDPVGTLSQETTVPSGTSAIQARQVIAGRNFEKNTKENPQDPDTLEAFETGDSGEETKTISDNSSANGFKPYTKANGYNLEGKLIFLAHTDPRISPSLGAKLEKLSDIYGQKLTITSAYRTKAYNDRVGGAKNSLHLKGIAVDVVLANANTNQRLEFIKAAAAVGMKGIGTYFPSGSGGRFIHVDLAGKRQWGPSGSRTSQYAWAKPTLKALGWYVT